MAHTAALPFGIAQYEVDYVPRANAVRHIPAVFQPRFGIVANGVIPGSVPTPNAFYNPLLDFVNAQPLQLLTPNMPQNLYLGFIPGLSRVPQP
jgi:hypothetical protein